MPFNSLDKALLDRAVRRTSQDAVDHKASVTINGIWPNTPDGRRDKRLYDALNRDAGDLKALQQRMMREVGDASVLSRPRLPKVPPLEEAPPALIPGAAAPLTTDAAGDWQGDTNLTAADVKKDWKADAAGPGGLIPGVISGDV